MYHGKYENTRTRDTTHAQWWLTAGCAGLVVTSAFVALTLWLGMEEPRSTGPTSTDFRYNQSPPPTLFRRPQEDLRNTLWPGRGKVEKVAKEDDEKEEKKPTHLKLPIPHRPTSVVLEDNREVELRTYQGTLNHGEELMKEIGVKESNIKKKSEAIFPSGFDPDLFLSRGVFHSVDNTKADSSSNFVTHERPEIPPFTYIKGSNPELEDRIDYSEDNPVFYADNSVGNRESENSVFGFFRKRLEEVREWLSARGDREENSDWLQLLLAFNQSITQRNLTAILTKLREMYNTTDVADVPVSSLLYPDAQNGSSLLSFGLLAVDLFLLHNVQQIAWNEEARLGAQMLDDPEVVAMNALFLPPDRVHQLRQKGSRVLKSEGTKGVLSEALEFVNSMLRAILNLNKAFRSSGRARDAGPNTVDCVWTLYCRNLDKTARLDGPYGFLAKMNSLGLRLMMGEFPAERAFSQLVSEATQGWTPIDCERLFPRCSAEDAKEVVMNTVLGDTPAAQT